MGANLKAANITLKANEKVVIRDNATVEATGDVLLESFGDTEKSRSHIRHTSNVTAANLTFLEKLAPRLGDSFYHVTGKIHLRAAAARAFNGLEKYGY